MKRGGWFPLSGLDVYWHDASRQNDCLMLLGPSKCFWEGLINTCGRTYTSKTYRHKWVESFIIECTQRFM